MLLIIEFISYDIVTQFISYDIVTQFNRTKISIIYQKNKRNEQKY